jgi:hypothetical protein
MDLFISIFYIAVIVLVSGLILLLVLRSQGIKFQTPAFFDPFHLEPMLMGGVSLIFAVVGLFTSEDFVTWIPTPIFVAAAFAAMIYYSLKRT